MIKNILIYIIASLLVALPFAVVFYFFLSEGNSFLNLYIECAAIALLTEIVRKLIKGFFK